MQADTIAAIATAPGEAGVGIVRVSGARALAVAENVFRSASQKKINEIKNQQAVYGHIMTADGATVDEALLLVMRAPHSYTKEDVVELQCHGGTVVLRRVLGLVLAAGARLAERGEFTKRAFLNGRLDLAQAQAVMDIVGARTDRALALAEGHLAGDFSGKIHAMREKCLGLVAHLEAAIDFPEDDVDEVVLDDVEHEVTAMRREIRALLATAHTGKILREGLMTAIVGRPNVGKSSLLNALLREERAIVTEIPGTTRDSIEEYADIGGVPLRIIDTAGIREAEDEVEKIGVEKAEQYAARAALVFALFDGSQPLTAEDENILCLVAGRPAILLLTKSDLPAHVTAEELKQRLAAASASTGNTAQRKRENQHHSDVTKRQAASPAGGGAEQSEAEGAQDARPAQPPQIFSISTKTGAGIPQLAEAIGRFVGLGAADEAGFVSDERDAALLRAADEHLGAALKTIGAGLAVDFVSIDLNSALEKLGEITGETAGEDVIDEIFSRFCIGK